MKTTYLLLAGLVVVLGSCSTAYRSGQTPDDVYYSPAPETREVYVTSNNQRNADYYGYSNAEEREIRRGIRDKRYRASVNIGMGVGYSPFSLGYSRFYSPFYDPFYSPYAFRMYDPFWGHGYSSFGYGYNPYFGFGSHYPHSFWNPYYGGHYGSYYPPAYYPPVVSGKANTNTGPRTYNLNNYRNTRSTGNSNVERTRPGSIPLRTFGNRNTTPSVENRSNRSVRRVFTPSQNNSSSNESERRYTPSRNQSEREYRPTNTTPTRTFERSSTPPARSTTPPPTNNSRVRTFRNN